MRKESLTEAPADSSAVSRDVPALEVRNLSTSFRSAGETIPIVRGVSFAVDRGASLGLVGESGSGKSMTALSIMGLMPRPAYIASGEVLLAGRDLVHLRSTEMSTILGRELAMVFQEPTAALNPVYTVGYQIAEALMAHQDLKKREARCRARELLELVGIRGVDRVMRQYPHQLSGGMCQRVTIGTALANNPSVLILDEPTTALDTTIQAQILDVVIKLQETFSTALVFVSHDIAVVSEVCDEMVVMYGGRVMEYGLTSAVIGDPRHPYTVGLIKAALSVTDGSGHLETIPGEVPDPRGMPPGCPFSTRCPHTMEVCRTVPPMVEQPDGRKVACWLY